MLDRTTQALAKVDLPAITPWMRGHAPSTKYSYSNPQSCPCAQFLEWRGYRDVEVAPGLATFAGGSMKIPPEVDFVLSAAPHTYGAALDRAHALVQR